jgi:hypothetical protein
MTKYATAEALRAAIESRLLARSRDEGLDLDRLRRGVVFERVLTRLDANDPGGWVLKGGAGMELRFRDRARTTKDLDLVLRAIRPSGDEARDRLIEALDQDLDGDRFRFAVGPAQALAEEPGRARAYRFHLDGLLAGRTFAALRIDVVPRAEELQQTERMDLPGALAFAAVPTRSIEIVTSNQQFAEKLHALTRDYGGEQSSRLRDLLDIVLLLENSALDEPTLREVVDAVFAARGSHPVPQRPPDVPESWRSAYPTQAGTLRLNATSLDAAVAVLHACFIRLVRPPGMD